MASSAMSKAFTKDDASDDPVVVVPRAPLPPGTPNYVTPRGLAALRAEMRALDAERARLEGLDAEVHRDRARELTAVHARIRDLGERLAGAVPVDPRGQPHDEVRFGAEITVEGEHGERRYEIVGVDEADAPQGRIAFVSPLARALLGKRVGDEVTVRTPRGKEELEILAIAYHLGGVGEVEGEDPTH
ncbi:GreA/GreB family elongation factor [Pendulispora brunnea]|uniref:GreA/GreB family elongation factor n=1 Tax=Pendulispora brunnea TaxID=2905690 RepID=A0ABZ2KQC1_9BACT